MVGVWLLENKLMRMIEMGKVSKEGVVKAGKAGMLKPFKEWRAGVNRGTDNILKKLKYKQQRTFSSPLNSMADPEARKLRLSDHRGITSNKERTLDTIITRHEADEARHAEKLYKKSGIPLRGRGPVIRGEMVAALSGKTAQVRFNRHLHPNVVKNEQKLVNTAKAYNKKSHLEPLLLARGLRKEYEVAGMVKKKGLKRFEKRAVSDMQRNYKEGVKVKGKRASGGRELMGGFLDYPTGMKTKDQHEAMKYAAEMKKVLDVERIKRAKSGSKEPIAQAWLRAADKVMNKEKGKRFNMK